jgi:hypothetical protein
MPDSYASELAKKLNVKNGMQLHVIGRPDDVDLDTLPTSTSTQTHGVLMFVKTLGEVEATCDPLVEAAKEDRLAWIAYPKAGKLGTDLNRDILWRYLVTRNIKGVRQVAINDVWSAMRFRPGE